MIVFDASALLAFFFEETGAEYVSGLLDDADVERYIHAANLCEVFHGLWRVRGETYATEAVHSIQQSDIIERSDMDGEFWRDAGALIVGRRLAKASLPLGDALGVALARRLDAEFVTADKHEIGPLHDADLVRALFVR